jgi:arylformamidase
MKVYDITIPLDAVVACWPGDTPYDLQWTMQRRDGASVNVSRIRLSVHTGTHADAPFHFRDDGLTIDRVPLETFVGPTRVIDVRGRARIRRQDLEGTDLTGTPRVLLRTDAWLDHRRFPETIPVMEPDVPGWLAQRSVVLVGVDVPSVDALASKDLPNHHALGAAGICIVESLALADIAPGVYLMIALPLRLVGADGAPVRAALYQS